MCDRRPGLNAGRLVRLMRKAVARCQLDLGGAVVFTEAATGAYAVTPILAALAGARRVYALTRTTSYGTAEEVTAHTRHLARLAGVDAAVEVVTRKRSEQIAEADIVTNSGHVRPLDRETIGWMKPGAAIPLMYESWELRPGEVDLEACRRRGVRVAGTNERHPEVDVFTYLGTMAVKLLLDAGVAVCHNSVLVLCDNPFAPFIRQGLERAGAAVDVVARLDEAAGVRHPDAVVVAATPRPEAVVAGPEAAWLAARWPDVVVAQFWGDLDREALAAAGVAFWPSKGPARGHMGVLPSAVGPEPVLRLQAGGLKVGEVLWRTRAASPPPDHPFLDAYL
jgi:hypothetical protein